MGTTPDLTALAEGLTDARKRAFREAVEHDDGEVYAKAYSVPDQFTKSYRVYGRGDPLNRTGLALRAHLLKGNGDATA